MRDSDADIWPIMRDSDAAMLSSIFADMRDSDAAMLSSIFADMRDSDAATIWVIIVWSISRSLLSSTAFTSLVLLVYRLEKCLSMRKKEKTTEL